MCRVVGVGVDDVCSAEVYIHRCLRDNCHFSVRVLSVTPYVARPVLHDGVGLFVCDCLPHSFITGCFVVLCWLAVTPGAFLGAPPAGFRAPAPPIQSNPIGIGVVPHPLCWGCKILVLSRLLLLLLLLLLPSSPFHGSPSSRDGFLAAMLCAK